jgi:hypothetical protein
MLHASPLPTFRELADVIECTCCCTLCISVTPYVQSSRSRSREPSFCDLNAVPRCVHSCISYFSPIVDTTWTLESMVEDDVRRTTISCTRLQLRVPSTFIETRSKPWRMVIGRAALKLWPVIAHSRAPTCTQEAGGRFYQWKARSSLSDSSHGTCASRAAKWSILHG